jgi:hypothetical protein
MEELVRKPPRRLGVTYSRLDLSHYHLYSAFLFMQHAENIEESASQMADSDILYRYRSFVMGSVLSSVAFLEAKIAELHSDADDGIGLAATGLTTAQRKAIAAALDALPHGRTLERYQSVLRTLAKAIFKADQDPYRSVSLVVTLRNYLVHFDAEWLAVPEDETSTLPQSEQPRIERQLKGQFPSTKFAWDAQPFFPDHCLSAGCARWAAESTLSFAQEFSTRAGIVMKHLIPTITVV